MGVPVSLGGRLAAWRPATPPLPDHLAPLVSAGDPEWFGREMAIAAAPPWWFWRFALRRFSWLVDLFGTVEVTGSIPEELRNGPLLLAANHIGDFDPFVIAVALHELGVMPRMMATGGIFDAPSSVRCSSAPAASASSAARSSPARPSGSPRSRSSTAATWSPIPRAASG